MATENGKDYRVYVTSGSSVIAGETTSSITINEHLLTPQVKIAIGTLQLWVLNLGR